MAYKLSILDQSPVIEHSAPEEAFQETVRLAQTAEQLGYERFWVSEHHNSQDVHGSSPEVLVSYLLAKTEKIRIGSGGVMLTHYSPYKVAENFQVLAALAPGRVDLGVGKAPGGLPLATKALQFGTQNTGEDFNQRVRDLKDFLYDTLPENHPLYGVKATPTAKVKPPIFVLGGSPGSATLAATLKLPYVFARFFVPDEEVLKKSAEVYREIYPEGKLIVGIGVFASEDEKEAESIAKDSYIIKLHLESGRTYTFTKKEQAEKFGNQSEEPYRIEVLDSKLVYGKPEQVKKVLDELHQKYQVDEFILHTPVLKREERFRSFELLGPTNLFKEISTVK
ncbi:LLM class flavin-dependent oxidoreductase [Ureibacillus sp. FSL K6-8385]|uniref:LLM class flavin-dependent oxidoreductase n=1 Tax=Ureibacillus terrenus TaxID=118246 RepID=A0A540V365_9BACL|nr:LLM class flavin-dependent oxidoreductase [Ureibacillus terrenus]MED3662736.1 LLM class flavin-dependent oxidoreductase [Ureibacillus terrenus]MED3763683.1 LLM class flavin-dependent oxidoreductase [Ureibacillus terrenus]TQE91186.1 LLM class flavin-dependent oxidoreductase [Ureibacillus terrenus]